MNEILNSIRRSWGLLVQFACWIGVTIGTFVPEPPLTTLTAPPDIALKRFAQFLGAVIIGLFLIGGQKRKQKAHTKMWVKVTIVTVTLTISAFFLERTLKPKWTCSFAGQVITIGGQLTNDAQTYSSTLPGEVTCDRLLADYGGDPFQVWNKDQSERRYLLLSALMVMVWLGAASCIMSITQAIRCATTKHKSKNRKPLA